MHGQNHIKPKSHSYTLLFISIEHESINACLSVRKVTRLIFDYGYFQRCTFNYLVLMPVLCVANHKTFVRLHFGKVNNYKEFAHWFATQLMCSYLIFC